MEITSSGIVNGKILDKYGKRSSSQRFGMPTISFPIQINNAPKETKCFSLIFDDPDSINVCGYVWIHWLVTNLTTTQLEENASETNFNIVQGKNSWNDNSYGGPCPPDKPHNYRLRVFALKEKLDLRGDFTIEQLEKEMEGKILDTTEIFATYDN